MIDSDGMPISPRPNATDPALTEPGMTEIPIPSLLIDSSNDRVNDSGDTNSPGSDQEQIPGFGANSSPAADSQAAGSDSSAGDALQSAIGFADNSMDDVRRVARPDLVAWEQAQPLSTAKSGFASPDLLEPSSIRVVAASQRDEVRIGADREIYCPTLAQGIEFAKRYEIGVVEIISPKIFSAPIRIDAENLRIESATNQSIIVFDSGDSMTMQRPSMCTLGPGITEFQDLHFVWDVPEDEVDGGAMFQAEAGSELSLSGSTITINNPAKRGEVYAIDVVTEPKRNSVDDFRDRLQSASFPYRNRGDVNRGDLNREEDSFPMVAIDFDNVIVRGQATMIHMDYAAKLWLRWNNGLLAVSGRMIDTAGAREPLSSSVGPMILLMTRVTAHAESGICRVRLGANGSYPFSINRSARNCVFIVEDSLPHFDFVNFPISADTNSGATELRLGGSSNVYVVDPLRTDPLVRMTMSDGEVRVTEVNALATSELDWADESPPRWNVVWEAGALPTVSMSSRRPSDYRQDQSPTPGFEEDSLPTLPLIAEF